MPDVSQLQPIFQETVDRIRARVNADANSGIDPNDAAFLDTSPGGFWWDITGAVILEIARLWDALGSEVVAAQFPAFAWGIYLDAHGVTVGLTRKLPAKAGGVVTFTGTPGVFIATGSTVATQPPSPDADPTIYETTGPATIPGGGTVSVAVQAINAGAAGNVVATAVTVLLAPIQNITAVSNAQPITGGEDVETDEQFRNRIVLAYQGSQGSGTVADYQGWALAYPGVGYVTVQPLWAGAGTVRVVVTDTNNRPVPTAVVTGLQTLLDPTGGTGLGLAPIGAIVTVATPSTLTVNVVAALTLRTGYTLDGAGGTIALGTELAQVVHDYIDTLPPNTPVILKALVSRLFDVAGVSDVGTVTLNGSAANLAVGSLQVALTGTVSLS